MDTIRNKMDYNNVLNIAPNPITSWSRLKVYDEAPLEAHNQGDISKMEAKLCYHHLILSLLILEMLHFKVLSYIEHSHPCPWPLILGMPNFSV
jgi:hypothetical protein